VGRSAGANAGRRGDHRRHHQLHQHQQPAQRDRRRPAGAQRQQAGPARKPWVKSSLAPGSKAVQLYLEEAGLLPELENWASASSPLPAPPATACPARWTR
jgi:aconitate hydratase